MSQSPGSVNCTPNPSYSFHCCCCCHFSGYNLHTESSPPLLQYYHQKCSLASSHWSLKEMDQYHLLLHHFKTGQVHFRKHGTVHHISPKVYTAYISGESMATPQPLQSCFSFLCMVVRHPSDIRSLFCSGEVGG